ncbi:MAG: nickel/cobalt efflux protein RcnA [Gammaproteobacteria bacterium]|nr:nickel/cobalt efflux protein RcnA [Gammaproteobacteria bacterium]
MDIVSLIEAGSTSIVYLAAGGLVLGSLHGLEPGHSKTMMAAFIIAVRGSVSHAVLLGVSAAFSHSIIVWVLAWLALTYGNELIGEQLEPYLLLASGAIVLVIGAWMLYCALRVRSGHDHGHHIHGPGPDHVHHDHAYHGHAHHDHTDHALAHHSHEDDVPMDAHAHAHAREIEQKFQSGAATYTQTIGFGLTGGLIPCPAAITVLLLCLNIGQFWLGIGMVAAFSTGLALTLVAVGVAAAVGLKYARKRYGSIDKFYRIAPYVSGALIMAIGVLMGYTGWIHLTP